MMLHAYVTGTLPDEDCAVCGEFWWERLCQTGLPELVRATAQLLYELLFLCACVHVCVCLCVTVILNLPVYLFACIREVKNV